LKDGGAALGESPALARLRGVLVIFQAAFAMILLAGAALMIRSFHQLQQIDLGFDATGRAKVQINFPPDYPTGNEARLQTLREIQAELLRVPGVRAVGFGGDVLHPGYFFGSQILEGRDGATLKAAMVGFSIGYQEAAGITLKRGQWLAESMGNKVLVNEALATARWPDEDPIGQFLRPSKMNTSGEWKGWEVAGVVGDLRTSLRETGMYYIYTPEGWGAAGHSVFILRLARNYDEALAGVIRRKLYDFDPTLVVSQILPLEQLRTQQLWAERLANSVLSVLAAIALLLTLVGIFSVVAYSVDRRMNEFGLRAALGATRKDLAQLVLRKALALTLAGVVLGVGGALALTRFLASLLFETSAQDPWALFGVSVLILLSAGAASLLPSLRATRVDVARLLKAE
jgi:putative ABC transport system permease protein